MKAVLVLWRMKVLSDMVELKLFLRMKKYHALCLLMKHYHKEDCSFNPSVMLRTTVLKLTVEQISGKIHL